MIGNSVVLLNTYQLKLRRFLGLAGLLLVTVFGCGRNGPGSVFQGKAEWAPSAQAKEQESGVTVERLNSTHLGQLDLQKVYRDLGFRAENSVANSQYLLNDQINELREKILAEKRSQKPYNLKLVREFVEALRSADRKETVVVEYGPNKTKIRFVQESSALIAAFRLMASSLGQARVPLYDETQHLEKFVELPIGGDPIVMAVTPSLKTERGLACETVICALTSILSAQMSAQGQSPFLDRSVTPEEAAYDALFVSLYSGYSLGFVVPRMGVVGSQDWAKKMARFVSPTPYQARLVAQTLWDLPTHFSEMSSLLYILFDRGGPTLKRRPGEMLNLDSESFAHYHDLSLGLQGGLRSLQGYVLLNRDEFGGNAVRTAKEYPECSPAKFQLIGCQKQLRIENQMTLVHELTHAFDLSQQAYRSGWVVDLDVASQADFSLVEGFFGKRTVLSYSSSWLKLSGWQFIANPGVKRSFEAYNLMKESAGQEEGAQLLFRGSPNWIPEVTRKRFFHSYAMVNPREDLAVHAEGYFFNSGKLQELAPEKFQFVRDWIFTEQTDSEKFTYSYSRD